MPNREPKEPPLSSCEQDAISGWRRVLLFAPGVRRFAKRLNRRRARRRHKRELRDQPVAIPLTVHKPGGVPLTDSEFLELTRFINQAYKAWTAFKRAHPEAKSGRELRRLWRERNPR